MQAKHSLSVLATLLALGVAGPAAAIADGGGDSGAAVTTTAGTLATVTAPVDGQATGDSATADEQQTGAQDDVANTDLATQVEQVDGADGNGDVNQEDQVGDGSSGQVNTSGAVNTGAAVNTGD